MGKLIPVNKVTEILTEIEMMNGEIIQNSLIRDIKGAYDRSGKKIYRTR